MAKEEVKFRTKSCILFIVFSDILIANALRQKFHQTRLVFETDGSSLPISNRHNDFEEDNSYSPYSLDKKAASFDDVCKNQIDKLQRNLADTVISHTHTANATAMAMAWVGENDENLICVVSVSEGTMEYSTKSYVLRSVDYGVTYVNLIQIFDLSALKKNNGLSRNPSHAKKVYLIGEGNFMYTSADSGLSFRKIDLAFSVSGELIFSDFSSDYLMVQDADKNLFVSKDNGDHWKQVNIQDGEVNGKKVHKAVWGIKPEEGEDHVTNKDSADTIYITYYYLSKHNGLTLAKSTDGGKTYIDLLTAVTSFERKGKFLLATKKIQDEDGPGHIQISTDGGNNFQNIKIPATAQAEAFHVVAIEQNRIFLHVGDYGETSQGTLYISDSGGIVYSRSLNRHLLLAYTDNAHNNFYKVESMRGVYITSQISEHSSIHTLITYNSGADWQRISRPEGVPCKNESKDCYLKIHDLYSIKHEINDEVPVSHSTAAGLIFANGHVADALQKTDPDVFVSRDGGYTWQLALKGPHLIYIGGNGGIAMALSISEPNPQFVKVSFDEGRCWYEYNLKNQDLSIAGMLLQPTRLAVCVFGNVGRNQWDMTVVDFMKINRRKCSYDDYEPWSANTALYTSDHSEVRRCDLGLKVTFKRLKKGALCFKGHEDVVNSTVERCTCTKTDYECDYGYMRDEASHECIKESFFTEDVNKCLPNYDNKNITLGYRKIPGNKCVGGFAPPSVIGLQKMCNKSKNTPETPEVSEPQAIPTTPGTTSSTTKQHESDQILAVSVPIAVVTILLVVSLFGIFLARQYMSQRRWSKDKIALHTEEHDI